MVEQLILQAE